MRVRYALDRSTGVYIDRDGLPAPVEIPRYLRDLSTGETCEVLTLTLDLGCTGRQETSEHQTALELNSTSADSSDAGATNAVVARSREEIDEVWAHYVAVMKPRGDTAGPDERRIIREALKVASVDECKEAVSRCGRSPFHMGENPRRKKYNKLSDILRGKRGRQTVRERIDFFLELPETDADGAGFSSANSARIGMAKRDVIDAWTFPRDEAAQRRGKAGEEWLQAQGWTITRDPETGKPQFRPPS